MFLNVIVFLLHRMLQQYCKDLYGSFNFNLALTAHLISMRSILSCAACSCHLVRCVAASIRQSNRGKWFSNARNLKTHMKGFAFSTSQIWTNINGIVEHCWTWITVSTQFVRDGKEVNYRCVSLLACSPI